VKKLLVVCAGFILLSGCAFSRQKATLSPSPNIVSSDEGKSVAIAVRVTDERPSQSLGRRGSAYGPAAEITAAQNVADVVQEQIQDGLRKKGFNPMEYSEGKDRRLTVEVRLLEYSTSTGFWTGGVHIRGALKVAAACAGKNYEKMYRSDKEERVVVVPDAKMNEKWINDALTDVLQQVFDDAALLAFLVAPQ
jgi:uncharacterized lipoprotein YajG